MVYTCYSPPQNEKGGDGRQLPLPPPEPEQAALPAPKPKGPAGDPDLLLKKAVRKKFGRRYYNGTVTRYKKAWGYHIEYEDGDEEDLNAADVEQILVDAP